MSVDDEKSHQNFIAKQKLNFPLLADVDKKMVNDYGLWGEKTLYGRKYMGTARKTYLVNENGVIDKIIRKVDTKDHTNQIYKELQIS